MLLLIVSGLTIYHGVRINSSKGNATNLVRVYVDNQLYCEEKLIPGKRIEIRQDGGEENILMLTADGFFMESANCHNQSCVHQGSVTADNYRMRTLGNRIICIPNRVTVELVLDPMQPIDPDLPDV